MGGGSVARDHQFASNPKRARHDQLSIYQEYRLLLPVLGRLHPKVPSGPLFPDYLDYLLNS